MVKSQPKLAGTMPRKTIKAEVKLKNNRSKFSRVGTVTALEPLTVEERNNSSAGL
jgi:hypothetical protein